MRMTRPFFAFAFSRTRRARPRPREITVPPSNWLAHGPRVLATRGEKSRESPAMSAGGGGGGEPKGAGGGGGGRRAKGRVRGEVHDGRAPIRRVVLEAGERASDRLVAGRGDRA